MVTPRSSTWKSTIGRTALSAIQAASAATAKTSTPLSESRRSMAPSYLGGPASATVASVPPSPMVSTAEDGTITIEPFSLMAS